MLSLPDPPLADDLVRLRPFRSDDLRAIVAGCSDPLTQAYTRIPSPYTHEDGRAFISGAAGAAPARRDDRPGDHGRRRGPAARGRGGSRWTATTSCRGEIGYWVAPEARGRGLAGRALALMSRWALTQGGLQRLDLQAALDNAASIRAAERCGYVREGTLRRAWYRSPERTDMALFSLLPDDLPA